NLQRQCVRELGGLGCCGRRFGERILRGACRRLRLPGGWRHFRVAKWVPLRTAGGRTTGPARGSAFGFLLFRWHGKRWSVLSGFLRGPVVPANEERDVVRIVHRLNRDAGRGRMELAYRLRDLPDDRKPRLGRGGK